MTCTIGFFLNLLDYSSYFQYKMLARSLYRFISNKGIGFRQFSIPAVQPHGIPLNEGPPSALPTEDRVISPKIAALVEEIAGLSLLDVSDLNWALKKRLNISDQPMMAGMMMAAPVGGSASTEDSSESTSDIPQKMTFSVKLTKFDDTKKIALIKEIRSVVPGLNLVQAKKFVETAPVVVKDDMGKAEAEEMKAVLEKAGAVIEIV